MFTEGLKGAVCCERGKERKLEEKKEERPINQT
jgi:hypothetical protein